MQNSRTLFYTTCILLFICLILVITSSCNNDNNRTSTPGKDSLQGAAMEQAQDTIQSADRDLLVKMIREDNIVKLEEALAGGTNVNSRMNGFLRGGRSTGSTDVSDKDWTLLMFAAFYNKQKIATLLLRQGADINAQNAAGHTALFLACASRNDELAELLLRHDADATIDCKDADGQSTLQWAISYEWPKVAAQLLDKGAPVNGVSTETGRSVLLEALYSDHIPAALSLKIIEKGADVHYQNPLDGENALMRACMLGYEAIAQQLLNKGVDVNLVSKNGGTALSYAALGKDCATTLLALLVAKGAQVNIKNKYGRSALIEAVSSNCLSKVQFLLSRGAIVNQKSEGFGGVSPLTEAVWNTNPVITKYLLDHGADPNIERDNGEPVLLVAVWNEKNLDIVQMLLDRGARVNQSNDDKQTPLLKAIQYNLYDIAVLLLKHGAATDVVDVYGRNVKTMIDETVKRTGDQRWLTLL